MRHDQHAGCEPRGRARDQLALRGHLDVARKQHAAAVGGDHEHHARGVVAGVRAVAQRMQQVERDPIPAPGLPGDARHARRGQPRRVADHPLDGDGLEQGRRAADVIRLRVAQHQRVDAVPAGVAQERRDHGAARIERRTVTRPGIVDEGVMARAHHHREALPDVEQGEPERAGRRPRHGPGEQRQQAGGGHRPAGDAAREHQHQRAGDRGGERRPRRRGPGREARHQRCQALEQGHEQREAPRRRPEHGAAERRQPCLECHAREQQRHDHESGPWHREQVGERRDQRILEEQRHGERREPHRDQPLHVTPAPPQPGERAGTGTGRARPEAEHDHGHRGEGQPEARGERRQGIQHQHRGERGGEPRAGADPPAQPQREHEHGEHHQRALGGQREAGERGVRRAGTERGERRGALRGQMSQARQAGGGARPQPARGGEGEPGDEPHVQSGNGHEMGGAGLAQHAPLRRAHAPAIAHRKRGHQRRGVTLPDPRHHALGEHLAHSIEQRRRGGAEPLVARVIAHVAGGGEALQEEPALVVEAARIERSARALEPHAQAPALARAGGAAPTPYQLMRTRARHATG